MKKPKQLLAGRAERFFAYIIDTLLLLVPQAILAAMLGTQGLVILAGFIVNMAYFVHFTASHWQATPGQRLLNVYVIHVNGTPLSLRDAVERFLAFTLPVLPMYTSAIPEKIAPALTLWLVFVWFMPILITDKRMGVHDKICGTRVVMGKADA